MNEIGPAATVGVFDLTVRASGAVQALGMRSSFRGMGNHPVWSQSRDMWVPLAGLRPGEWLRTPEGAAVVLAAEPVPGGQPVWNLEVHGHHTYHAGTAGVLVHDNYGNLKEFYRQVDKYGAGAISHLPGGQVLRTGRIEPAKVPGRMIGSREMKLWNPSTGVTYSWRETLTHSGDVAQIRFIVDGVKHHWLFDASGNMIRYY